MSETMDDYAEVQIQTALEFLGTIPALAAVVRFMDLVIEGLGDEVPGITAQLRMGTDLIEQGKEMLKGEVK